MSSSIKTQTLERTTAAAFPRHPSVHVVADSASLRWSGIYVRRHRYPRVVDRFLVPATPEPLITCIIAGSAEWRERDVGGAWTNHKLVRGDIFVTRSKIPYEVRWSSPRGEEIEVISMHLAIDHFLAALETTYPGHASEVEVVDFFGRDEALAHLCFACAEMLAQRVPGTSTRVAPFIQLVSAWLRNIRQRLR